MASSHLAQQVQVLFKDGNVEQHSKVVEKRELKEQEGEK